MAGFSFFLSVSFVYTLEVTLSDVSNTFYFRVIAYALVSAKGGWKMLIAIKCDNQNLFRA